MSVFGHESPEESFAELKAKVLYGGQNGDIIDQYITFCQVLDEQIRLYGRTRKAIEETIRICRDRNGLKDYLARKEAAEFMEDLFDKEALQEILKEQMKEEGREEGIDLLGSLMTKLKSLGREDDAFRAAADSAYREKLLHEFQMV